MIPVHLTEDEAEALLRYIGPILDRWGPSAGEPLERARHKLDMAVLHHEENRLDWGGEISDPDTGEKVWITDRRLLALLGVEPGPR